MGKFLTWLQHIDKTVYLIKDACKSGKILWPNLLIIFFWFQVPR